MLRFLLSEKLKYNTCADTRINLFENQNTIRTSTLDYQHTGLLQQDVRLDEAFQHDPHSCLSPETSKN